MSKVLAIDDTDNPEIVGQLGAQLAKLAKISVNIVDGFVIPVGQKLEDGASNAILTAFDKLGAKSVILRSSVNARVYDSEVIRKVKRDILLDTISYMQKNAARHGRIIAVVVQRDLEAEVSGTIHSINPVTLDTKEMLIEANLWMNDTVLSGESDADMIIVNKRTGALTLESDDENEICLTPRQISQLHTVCRKISDRFKYETSVDWAYDNGKLFILRARPIDEKTLERFK